MSIFWPLAVSTSGVWCAPLPWMLPWSRALSPPPVCPWAPWLGCAHPDRETCGHPRTIPPFDPGAAAHLPAAEVRRLWPRFWDPCPDCGALAIGYASLDHFVAGDW